MKIKKHLNLLGLKVEDKITGFGGIVSSMSFDLYGCVQGLVSPAIDKKDGKIKNSMWFDVNRLKIINKKPVMERPDFDYGLVAEGKKGAAIKPVKI